jgi:hypothetical protein
MAVAGNHQMYLESVEVALDVLTIHS